MAFCIRCSEKMRDTEEFVPLTEQLCDKCRELVRADEITKILREAVYGDGGDPRDTPGLLT